MCFQFVGGFSCECFSSRHLGCRCSTKFRRSGSGYVVVTATCCHDASVSKHNTKHNDKEIVDVMMLQRSDAKTVTLPNRLITHQGDSTVTKLSFCGTWIHHNQRSSRKNFSCGLLHPNAFLHLGSMQEEDNDERPTKGKAARECRSTTMRFGTLALNSVYSQFRAVELEKTIPLAGARRLKRVAHFLFTHPHQERFRMQDRP